VAERRLPLVYANSPLSFLVLAEVAEFTMTLTSPAPGETAMIRVRDP
jgi:hypothetical protein